MADGPTSPGDTTIIVDLVEDAGPAQGPAAAAGADVVVISDDGAPAPLPARATEHPDGSVTLPLLFPVVLRYRARGSETVREERCESLTFGRLNGADMRAIAASATGGAGIMVTLARSARMPEGKFGPLFDRLDAADIDDALAVVARFLGSGRKTGR
jgi:hypothetical protein